MNHDDAWDLLPDVAAGYLSPELGRALDQHVAECASCRDELDALQHAVMLLHAAPASLDPPSALRDRVLQIPDAPARELSAAVPLRRRRGVAFSRRWQNLVGAAALGAAAAAVITAILVSGDGFSASHTAALTPWKGSRGASGKLECARSDGANVPCRLVVSGLRAVPDGGFYEAWLGRPGVGKQERQAVATFTPDSHGRATVSFSIPRSSERAYRWIWVTRERDDNDPGWSKDTVFRGPLV